MNDVNEMHENGDLIDEDEGLIENEDMLINMDTNGHMDD